MDIKNKQIIICKVCKETRFKSTKRIEKTGVCLICAIKIIPDYIPQNQYIKYLLLKGYKNEMSSL